MLQFFKLIDLHVRESLDIHVVLDNLSAHKAPPVAKWLADPKRARWHLHFTPTSSSWLNLVESWFSILTERRLRRGAFTSVDHLVVEIETWTEHWNDDPKWQEQDQHHRSASTSTSRTDQDDGAVGCVGSNLRRRWAASNDRAHGLESSDLAGNARIAGCQPHPWAWVSLGASLPR